MESPGNTSCKGPGVDLRAACGRCRKKVRTILCTREGGEEVERKETSQAVVQSLTFIRRLMRSCYRICSRVKTLGRSLLAAGNTIRRSDGGGEPGRRLLVREVRNDGVGWGVSSRVWGSAQGQLH